MKWHKAYPGETWQTVKTGMIWSLYYLGATVPKGSFDSAVVFKDSTTFSFNLNYLGFEDRSLLSLQTICDSIKKTSDYRHNDFIDLSRFLVLTLYSSYNYYQITNADPSYSNFVKRYKLSDPITFGVTNSSVSKYHRLIKFTKDTSDLFNMGFVAEEGKGSLFENTFKPDVFETFDMMPNGQFRFAIYNKEGKLIDASPADHSEAGKPGKCMWCHETNIPPLFTKNIAVEKMLSNVDFTQLVQHLQKKLDSFRAAMSTDMNFKKQPEHTTSELLYISFMEPSMYRLRHELNNDTLVLQKIRKLPTHLYDEFPFLGNLYTRKIVDKYFTYSKIRVPDFIREKSKFEPDYYKLLDLKKRQ